jgi:hypothetical protein
MKITINNSHLPRLIFKNILKEEMQQLLAGQQRLQMKYLVPGLHFL